MLYEKISNKSFDEIMNIFENKAKEEGFGTLKIYQFHEILEGKGFPIKERIAVFEICHPAYAQKVLTKNPEIASLLPCRISIRETSEGVIISTVKPSEIINQLQLEEIKEVGKEVESIINKIIDSIV